MAGGDQPGGERSNGYGFAIPTTVRNAQLDAMETAVGVSAIPKIRTGAAPANCGTADSGTVLATLNLPSDWMAAASGGVKGKSGTWSDAVRMPAVRRHFRLYASDGTTCHAQGTVGTSATDMIVDNTSFSAGQSFTITQFDITAGNA